MKGYQQLVKASFYDPRRPDDPGHKSKNWFALPFLTWMVFAGLSADGGKGSHSQPSKVECQESIAPSVRDGSEVDQYDVDDLQLGHVPSGSSPGEVFDVLACCILIDSLICITCMGRLSISCRHCLVGEVVSLLPKEHHFASVAASNIAVAAG